MEISTGVDFPPMRRKAFLLMNKASFIVLALAATVASLSSCKPSPSATAPEPVGTPTPSATAVATPAATPAATPLSTPAASTPAPAASTPAPAASTPAPAVDAATPTEQAPAATETPSASGERSANVELKDPVATVNGETITKAQLDEAFEKAVQMTGVKVGDLTSEQKVEGYRQLLDELITEKLVTKAATGVTVPQAEIDAQIAKIKAQFPSEEDFSKQLAQVGQSPEQLSETIKKMLQQQHWLESQIAGKTDVTDEEAKKFYEANKTEFQQPDTVKASHILFLVNKDDSQDVVNQKLEAAKAAEARAKKGEDFNKLAKELSEEPGAKESGGDLGFFPKDRMVPEFAEAAFNQKVGDISDPVRTQYGWHIIKVIDKKPAGTLPYDDVKAQLMTYLKAKKQEEAAQALLKSLRSSAQIESTLPPPSPSPPPAASEPATN
jgi:parvulin-like peptidyl-prolyl isomerase